MDRVEQLASHFGQVPLEPADAIFGLAATFKKDPSEVKVDLVIGAYRSEDGKPWVLPVVDKVERILLDEPHDHEYIPIDGLREFTDAATALLLGPKNPVLLEGRYSATQFLSGTGCLRLGAQFLTKHYKTSSTIYIPEPTWPNHRNVFSDAGLQVKSYRYYNPKSITLDYTGLLEDLKVSPSLSSLSSSSFDVKAVRNVFSFFYPFSFFLFFLTRLPTQSAPNGSIILLHVCAHNPTGIDPTEEQWKGIAAVVKVCLLFFLSKSRDLRNSYPFVAHSSPTRTLSVFLCCGSPGKGPFPLL